MSYDPRIEKQASETKYKQVSAQTATDESRGVSSGTAFSESSRTASGDRSETQRQYSNIGLSVSFRVRVRGGYPEKNC
jgi:hypothetical protein